MPANTERRDDDHRHHVNGDEDDDVVDVHHYNEHSQRGRGEEGMVDRERLKVIRIRVYVYMYMYVSGMKCNSTAPAGVNCKELSLLRFTLRVLSVYRGRGDWLIEENWGRLNRNRGLVSKGRKIAEL